MHGMPSGHFVWGPWQGPGNIRRLGHEGGRLAMLALVAAVCGRAIVFAQSPDRQDVPVAASAPTQPGADGAARVQAGESPEQLEQVSPLRFLRVHVPGGGPPPIPRDGRRYVPMPLAAFDSAVGGIQSAGADHAVRGDHPGGVTVRLDHVRYDAVWTESTMHGTLSFDVVAVPDRLRSIVPLEGFFVESALVESADGTGAASLVGAEDGSPAILVTLAGRYRCSWRMPHEGVIGPSAATDTRVRLHLLPALSSTFTLQLPRDLHATLVVREKGGPEDGGEETPGIGTRPLATEPLADGGSRCTWLVGPVEDALIRVTGRSLPPPRLFVDNAVVVKRKQAEVRADIVPREPWDGASLSFGIDERIDVSSLVVTCVDASPPQRADWRVEEPSIGRRRVLVVPPDRALGTRMPLRIAALASFEADGAPEAVPIVSVDETVWGGGRIDVSLDASTTFARIEPEDAVVLPVDDGGDALPRVLVEQQSASGTVRVAVAARRPSVEVSRVTSVDLSPASVSGRASAALRVTRGEVFAVSGRVGPGWFVDEVEVDGSYGPADWRVDRDDTGGVLRISLVSGVSAGGEARLRVVGHRPPLPFGRAIGDERLEMVRFDGELAGETFIDLRADAETTVFVTGREALSSANDWLPDRVRALCEQQPPRLRLPGGGMTGQRRLTILRRRPPVDVTTSIRATVRDDRISESFTFNCSPRDTDLDSLVVHFSEPTDDALEWAVLAPSSARVVARRAEGDERRSSSTAVAGVESWVVDVQPPVRGPLAVRATRSLGWTERHRVPLAWVEGAPSRTGEIVVRDAGRRPPLIISGGLPELPDAQASSDRGAGGIATFMFDVDRDLRDGAAPVELEPGDADSADARAWVWSERTLSRCHASGAIEHETVLDIENHGRGSLALNHPVGTRLLGVSLDDIRLPSSSSDARGGGMRITLPAGRRFVQLAVRLLEEPVAVGGNRSPSSVLAFDPVGGSPLTGLPAWLGIRRFAAPSGLVDLPVLQRAWTVLLAPGLDAIAAVDRDAAGTRQAADWMRRLLGAASRSASSRPSPSPTTPDAFLGDGGPSGIDGGFRRLEVTGSGHGETASVLVVPRDVVVRLALAAGLIGLGLGWRGVRAGGAASRITITLLLPAAAVLALWLPEPWFFVPRAAVWGLGFPCVATSLVAPLLRSRQEDDGEAELPQRGWGFGLFTTGCLAGAAVGGAAVFSGSTSWAQPADVEKVFILDEPGGVALVPEPLYRRLSKDDASSVSSGPVLAACRVVAFAEEAGRGESPNISDWRYDLELDGAGAFVLDLPARSGRLREATVRLDGLPVNDAIESSGRLLRLSIPDGGRHEVSVGVAPETVVVGDGGNGSPVAGAFVRSLVHVPASASALLVVEPRTGTAAAGRPPIPLVAATRGAADGPWLPLELANAGATPLAGAVTVSLAWPDGEASSLLRHPAQVDCIDDIAWDDGACRLTVIVTPRFGDADPGQKTSATASVRWPLVELAIDPELQLPDPEEPIRDSAGRPVRVDRIGPGRLLVDWLSPVSGEPSVSIPLVMPLETPVGVFRVPRAWPRGVATDSARREVRLSAAASLRASVELAGASVRTPIVGPVGFEQVASWIPASDGARDLVSVGRRRAVPLASQTVRLSASSSSIRVTLEALLDAGSDAIAGLSVALPAEAAVESVRLSANAAGLLDPGRTVDVAVHRQGPTTLAICPQSPSMGRLDLQVDLLVPPPDENGWSILPLAYLTDAGEMPLGLTWRLPDGAVVTYDSEPFRDRESVPLPSVGEVPRYRLVPSPAATPEPQIPPRVRGDADTAFDESADERRSTAAAGDSDSSTGADQAPDADDDSSRVEFADVLLAVDGRGRAWGVVRFELVPADATPVIRLPRGLRLFGAFVDECPRRARPVDSSGWSVDLLDASRPRTVTAVFAGDLGNGLAAGDTVEIEPPGIDGVPTRRIAWSLRGPTGRGVRPVGPSSAVSAEAVAAVRREAIDRHTTDVIRAFEGRTPDEQMRIRRFLDRSGATDPSSPEATWDRSSRGLSPTVHVFDPVPPDGRSPSGGGRPLRFRSPAAIVPQTAGAAVATLLILAGAVGASRVWHLIGDDPMRRRWWRLASATAFAILAAVWALVLSPAWPGIVTCIWIAVLAIRRILSGWGESLADPAVA